ncbi:Signal transduction histidine kinase [Chitinophaga jiangningensis]|uniref:Oxygen sensor histidine kinase NreB n=1 Tax=Chitinophaga jiangningensis TaxID=1419482 RepID=A0A1M7CND1_9BACT|nr:sensor histidine kinase [Chitinophaga jiangningensis]SHL68771.1 Signal transduction histidine kinase [Chitinophaga jiangningensis]
MQISSKEFLFLFSLITIIFLIAPLFLIFYISLYNKRKKKYIEEKEELKKAFEHELLKSQMEVREQTLKTIALDLHDNIGQLLGLTIMTLSAVNVEDKEKAKEKIGAAEEFAKRSVKEVRALARLLHGEEQINRGLVAAIALELEWMEKARQYQVTYDHNVPEIPGSKDKETMLYRLFQESLNNIFRHAQAKEIHINLEYSNQRLLLSITDDGIGFNVNEVLKLQKGMGLHNLHKRAGMIGGEAIIHSAPGAGTQVAISIPYI